jgi:hypothetical protein
MIIDLDIERLDFTTNVHFINRIGGVIISVLVSSAVDRGFESWSGQTRKGQNEFLSRKQKLNYWQRPQDMTELSTNFVTFTKFHW